MSKRSIDLLLMHLSEKIKSFNYCPACGSGDISFGDMKKIGCRDCSFTYYHNVAAAVAAILEYDKKIVLIERAKDPGKGKLYLPGGFVDPKESAEEAIKREIKEELRIDVRELRYLGSYPNMCFIIRVICSSIQKSMLCPQISIERK